MLIVVTYSVARVLCIQPGLRKPKALLGPVDTEGLMYKTFDRVMSQTLDTGTDFYLVSSRDMLAK